MVRQHVIFHSRNSKALLLFSLLSIILTVSTEAAEPEGSYRQTCKDLELKGDLLTAQCLTRKEKYEPARLVIYGCLDDIANMDGQLSCSKGNRLPPSGSYKLTCRHIEMGTIVNVPMTAQCLARDGDWKRTNHSAVCENGRDLANINGQLSCQRPN